jgi:hypothetical protein
MKFESFYNDVGELLIANIDCSDEIQKLRTMQTVCLIYFHDKHDGNKIKNIINILVDIGAFFYNIRKIFRTNS